MYTLVKIEAFDNGSHDNITVESYDTIPEGWALLPDNVERPGFPFGIIEVAEVEGVMTVTVWTYKDPPTIPNSQLREWAYNNRKCITWDGKIYTVAEATHIWLIHASEGYSNLAAQITSLIRAAKDAIWVDYPD